jgi:hypothetical protein
MLINDVNGETWWSIKAVAGQLWTAVNLYDWGQRESAMRQLKSGRSSRRHAILITSTSNSRGVSPLAGFPVASA